MTQSPVIQLFWEWPKEGESISLVPVHLQDTRCLGTAKKKKERKEERRREERQRNKGRKGRRKEERKEELDY